MSEIRPVKTQKLKAAPQQAVEPAPTVDERLEVIGAALETALDPEATPKQQADALVKLRDGRKNRATDGKRQE